MPRTPEQRRELTKQRRQAVMSAGVRLPRRKVMPRQLQPTAIERAYYRDIIDLIDITLTDVREKLVPRLPSIIDQYLSETRVDTYGDTISTIFDDLRVGLARTMTDPRARALGDKYAVRTNAFNAQQVDRQFKTVLGISVLREEPWLQPKMGAFSKRNAQLIKSIPEEYLNNLETVVNTAVERGVSTKALEKQILSDMNIKPSEPTIRGARRINPKARARLIARDQISKFNGNLTQLRQTEIGIEKYIWSTAGDDRVRDEHAALNGQTFSWKTGAPELGGANPGDEIQCRCSAIPVMNKFFGVGETIPRAPEPKLPIPIPPKVKPPVPVAPVREMPVPEIKYKKFKTEEEILDWENKHYKDWWGNLTTKEEQAISQYMSPSGYKNINEMARTGKLAVKLPPEAIQSLKDEVKLVQSVLNKSIIPDDVVTYRGVKGRDAVRKVEDSVGRTINEKGFVSTSLDKEVTKEFVDLGGVDLGEDMIWRIKVPKGTKGAFVGGEENELLLQRNTKLKVVGKGTIKVREASFPVFDMEVLP